MQKSPYQIEHYRSKLAQEKKFSELKKTYTSKYPEIKDENSASFWNVRLDKKHTLKMEDGMTRKRIKISARFLPQSVNTILDIGIGYGFIEEILLKRRKDIKIFANDISPIAINYIKSKFPGIYKVESIYSMKYPANFFDAVFLLEVLEHIPPNKTFFVLENIKKVLKKNGFLILSVPMNEGLEQMYDNPNSHVRMYTPDLVMAELKIAGFEIISHKEIYAFSSLYWLKSQIAKVWKRWEPNNIIILVKSI